ncbi:hypothetical protein A2U01_0074718, partial [Trifolium medium]|nr:hypothetical protein [Trifolium medium]
TFAARARAPMWLPHSPSCISVRTFFASSGLKHSNIGVENPILYSLSVTTVYLDATRLSLAASSLFLGNLS